MDRSVFASAALALTIALSACGGGAVTSSSGTTTNNPPPPPPTPSDQWAWMSGSNYASSAAGATDLSGVFGTPTSTNVPGGRTASTGWVDSSGKFWVFGGYGLDVNATLGYLEDVWKFDPASNQWTRVSGSSAANGQAVFGTQGVAASQNTPGGRCCEANWTDASGNIWIFGGNDALVNVMTGGYLGDLWMFSPTANTWTWMGGSQTDNSVANYGSMGVPAASNQPGSRYASFPWTDSSGDFWMFGGSGPYSVDGSHIEGTTDQNDMWEYSPKTQAWTWVGGSIPSIHGKPLTRSLRNTGSAIFHKSAGSSRVGMHMD